MFKEMKLRSNIRRPFQITIGLREGYDFGIRHTTTEVEKLVSQWLAARMETGKKSVSGIVSSGTLVYAWNTPATGIKVTHEEVATFSGDVSPVYCADLTDEEVEEVLFNLASFIGERLKQTRMYVAYRDTIRVYQNDGETHPTQRPVTHA